MKITLPQSWSQVTLKQFIQLQNIEMNLSTDQSQLDYELESLEVIANIIAALNGLESNVITSQVTLAQLQDIATKLEWMNTKPELEKPDDKFKVIDIDKISYNKFVFVTNLKTEDLVNNMAEIVQGFTKTDKTKAEIEELPITQVLWIIDDVKKKYTKYAQDLIIQLQTYNQVQEYKHRFKKQTKKLGKKFKNFMVGISWRKN
jgi:hypothetical protein